jgi:hypothetical protein
MRNGLSWLRKDEYVAKRHTKQVQAPGGREVRHDVGHLEEGVEEYSNGCPTHP